MAFMELAAGDFAPLQDDILSHTCRYPPGSAVCQGVLPFGNPLFTGNKLPVNNRIIKEFTNEITV